MIERMFDQSLPEPGELHSVGDAALVEAIEGYTRASAASEGRRLAAIAELAHRRGAAADPARDRWVCDVDDSVAAEISAAMNISHGRALGQLTVARLLDERLPRINALLLNGQIPLSLVTLLRWRTLLVDDHTVIAALDAALADAAIEWGPLSQEKVQKKVDALIEQHDPDAVRRLQEAVRKREIVIGDWQDAIGTSSIHGRMLATDAAALKKRIAEMARGVCTDDPRTLEQRGADALGALAAGSQHLACLCGNSDCPAATDDGRATNTVIHILGDASVFDAEPDPAMHGDGKTQTAQASQPETEPSPSAEPAPAPAASSAPARRPNPGVILGGAIVPAALLAELIRLGAKVQYVRAPGPEPENHYAPSAKLAEYIRMRDMTCRHPGCDRPADRTDIDHTQPWPQGATHPSDLKCYCRIHHLIKTHWTGDGGWSDRQLPDGSVEVTTPAGKTYTTKPGASLLFPAWNITTTEAPPTGKPPPRPDQTGRAVPKRQRTRAQDHAYRIKAERAHNAALIADAKTRATKTKAQLAHRRAAAARNGPHNWETTTPTRNDGDPPPF
jgi:Domain of unknown function (DUF222)